MKYTSIHKDFFIENRQRFEREIIPASLAIFHSNDEMPRSGDSTFPFRQNPDLYYLSGIDQEQTTLILFPESPIPAYKEVLFIRKTDEHIAVWEGQKYTIEEAREASGIKTVMWAEHFNQVLDMLMHYAQNVYLNLNEHDRFATQVPYKDLRFANEIKNKYPLHQYHRAAPIMAKLRVIKSQEEVNQIKKAIDITDKAFRRVLSFVRPGVAEFEIEAEITHEFLKNRATGHAYHPIIASGKNACVLHYNQNNQVCSDGDLILLDFGAEYGNYNADLTRTIPVNGKFTQRQKDVYNSVLHVMKAARAMLIPGNTLDDYNKEVGKIMEEELVKLDLLKAEEVKRPLKEGTLPLYKKYFMHGASHYLGLDVHDVGNRYEPMKAGMIFTCEPGIYIPEEGIGIRLENDILITESGPIDLMDKIPVEAAEIEELMAEKIKVN